MPAPAHFRLALWRCCAIRVPRWVMCHCLRARAGASPPVARGEWWESRYSLDEDYVTRFEQKRSRVCAPSRSRLRERALELRRAERQRQPDR